MDAVSHTKCLICLLKVEQMKMDLDYLPYNIMLEV